MLYTRRISKALMPVYRVSKGKIQIYRFSKPLKTLFW